MSAEGELAQATRYITQARRKRKTLTEEMEKLYMAGVWKAAPAIKWRSAKKSKEPTLMTLRFPKKNGEFTGPKGEYLYIGADAQKQEQARKKVERTERFLELEAKRQKLTDWLIKRDREARQLAISWSYWPK